MEGKLNFGLKISELITQTGLSKTDFAKRIGYTLPGLSKILDKEDVNTEILQMLCAVFGIEMSYFFNSGSNISQTGKANIAGNGNIQYKGSSNTIGSTDDNERLLTTEIDRLQAQITSLKEQNDLLREMVEILKAKT